MAINKGARIGITIQVIALGIIILLVIFNKVIPSILSWIFGIGVAIALVGTLFELSKKNIKR
ncbi:hypothetical protein DES36_10813 [Alkalibaculum bacchi]|uniref:Uncharacterized protein n=1 Tax=Alkalibaculum bacchi TaxID=645887 RepID=A0A366I7W0_9FIRM|nr:hypothetical protein [Alkalibaculum bacchi]RBP64401.1 hypothetical protein DES36_10813 [Alkalibaculum bacchi]